MTVPHHGFLSRHRDELIMQVIGSLVLGLFVSIALYVVDQVREEDRNARDESLSNSLFVRQAVMSERELLPFSSLYLAGAQLTGLDLAGADLSDADLSGAELKRTDLTGSDLADADLSGVDLSDSDLTGASLIEAQLTGADLSGATFTGAILDGAELDGAFYEPGDPPEIPAAWFDVLEERSGADDDDGDGD